MDFVIDIPYNFMEVHLSPAVAILAVLFVFQHPAARLLQRIPGMLSRFARLFYNP